MNANQNCNNQLVTEFRYRADLSDAYHLVANQMNWLSTLISVANKDQYNRKTLLDIAEYLADCFADEHARDAKTHDLELKKQK